MGEEENIVFGQIFQRIREAGYQTKHFFSGMVGPKNDKYVCQHFIYRRIAFLVPRKVGVISFVEDKDGNIKVALRAIAPEYDALEKCIDTDDVKSVFAISKDIVSPEDLKY